MSYCRFSDGDVYMYPHVRGGIECCACLLTALVPTIFTKGSESFMGEPLDPCEYCGGEGCRRCMMHGSINFPTHEEALEHLLEHRAAGHDVPEYAIRRLQEELLENKND